MFFLIWGFRRRVVDAGRATFHCPVCKRSQRFALKRIARYFTLFFIPIVRTSEPVEYAVCLGCRNALKRAVLDAGQSVADRVAANAATPMAMPPAPRPAPPVVQTELRPAAIAEPIVPPPAAPAFGQSAFARATYARKRRPAPSFGASAPSEPAFYTPRR